jgi:nicotinamide-nucleotide amidase
MAGGMLARSPASFAVAVTGIAGPDGGTPAKPVGTVWIATAARGGDVEATLLSASGDRAAVRERSVARALELVLARIEATPETPR